MLIGVVFRTLLDKRWVLRHIHNTIGNPAYDALMMFKIRLLQTWYFLRDYKVEERINNFILFSEFLVLDIGLPSPDHSPIDSFRTGFIRLGIMDKLLHEFNKHVETDEWGLIKALITISAQLADMVVLPGLLEISELARGKSVLADKGYCSNKNSAYPLERGLIE